MKVVFAGSVKREEGAFGVVVLAVFEGCEVSGSADFLFTPAAELLGVSLAPFATPLKGCWPLVWGRAAKVEVGREDGCCGRFCCWGAAWDVWPPSEA